MRASIRTQKSYSHYNIQLQYSTIASIERLLETVIEASMTMACKMQLARHDTIL